MGLFFRWLEIECDHHIDGIDHSLIISVGHIVSIVLWKKLCIFGWIGVSAVLLRVILSYSYYRISGYPYSEHQQFEITRRQRL